MKTPHTVLTIALAFLTAGTQAFATIRYVDLNSGNPLPPYTSWATAATTIQDAVDAADYFGDQILVTNGVYQTGGKVVWDVLTNRVVVDKPVAIQSVRGPEFTIIQGYQVPGTTNGDGAIRCVYLTSGASLSGFTISQGATRTAGDSTLEQSGGGVLCASASAVVSNCVITGNAAFSLGGGVYSGTLNSCILTGNSASGGGGASGGNLNNCTLSGNSAGSSGGGASGATLNNCTLTGNSASGAGGGASGSTLNNCVITSNSATAASANGGGASGSTLNNCALRGNTTSGLGGGAYSGTLNNCTVTGNSAGSGGGVAGGQYGSCALTNCIVYFNQARLFGDNFDLSTTLNFCCTTPLPFAGAGNLTAEPQLAGNWHLSPTSPCRGAGPAVAATGLDLDGEAWANPPAVGCDEYQSGSVTGAVTVAILASYTNIATGFAVAFQELISGRVNASRWEFGDGTVVSNRPYATHAWDAAGDYPVVLRAYNESYPDSVAASVTVHVTTRPVHHVALDSPGPTPPYSSWLTAATNIQDAVEAATVPGALVWVSNGVYQAGATVVLETTNRVAVAKPLRVESVNGPGVTAIVGSGVSEPVRCVYLTGGAMLTGFTLTNGATLTAGLLNDRRLWGGGIYCEWPSAVVSNCVITGSRAGSGGGASGGTLNNCTLIGNLVGGFQSGGGAAGSRLNHCTVISNSASWGGGASECVLDNCILIGNRGADSSFFPIPFAGYGGGTDRSALDYCLVISNSAASGGGVSYSQLRNCTLAGNLATGSFPYNGSGGGGGASASTLLGCTLVGNSVLFSGVGGGGGANGCILRNCIAYFNDAPEGVNHAPGFFGGSLLDHCCTTPMPMNGVGNITNAPLFVETIGWVNLRLRSNSPCINAGNNADDAGSTDLDGRPRTVGGTVDMGAYEFQPGVSGEFIGWLSGYRLPTDGSSDYSDSDSDRMNNWQEWIAGTVPTDAFSALRLLNPISELSGVSVSWQSVSNRTYFLERAMDLGAAPSFSLLTSNIIGQAGTTSYTDTTAAGPGPFFYRVGVQQ